MDAQPTLAEALAFVALLRALVRFLRHTRGGGEGQRPLRPLFWWFLKENCFAASRYGIDARLIVSDEGDVRPLDAVARELLQRIAPHAAPDEAPLLERLGAAIRKRKLPYQHLRRVQAASGGSLEAVVGALTGALQAEGMVGSGR
jgi:carboxylate-amine ligase